MKPINKLKLGETEVFKDDNGMTVGYRPLGLEMLADKINQIVEWINQNKPDSPEKKWTDSCCEKCRFSSISCEDITCSCHKPILKGKKIFHSGQIEPGSYAFPHSPMLEVSQEKSPGIEQKDNSRESKPFIERILKKFETWFPYLYDEEGAVGSLTRNYEEFLCTALEEQGMKLADLGAEMYEAGRLSATEEYYLKGEENGLKSGRLAMKEEIENILETRNFERFVHTKDGEIWLSKREILAAIREKE